MGFIESFMGSGLANITALHEAGNALKNTQLSVDMDIPLMPREPKEQIDLPSDVQKGLYGRALEALNKGDFETAAPLLIRAIKIDPYNYPECYGALGVCCHISGKFDIALECYDRALHLYDRRKRAISDTNSNNILSSYLPQKDADQVNIMTIDNVRENKREIMEIDPDWKSPESWYESTYTWMYYPELIRRLSEKCEKREGVKKLVAKSAVKMSGTNANIEIPVNEIRDKRKLNVAIKAVDLKLLTLTSQSICPYCKNKLKKIPLSKTRCPSCKQFLYVINWNDNTYAVTDVERRAVNRQKGREYRSYKPAKKSKPWWKL